LIRKQPSHLGQLKRESVDI